MCSEEQISLKTINWVFLLLFGTGVISLTKDWGDRTSCIICTGWRWRRALFGVLSLMRFWENGRIWNWRWHEHPQHFVLHISPLAISTSFCRKCRYCSCSSICWSSRVRPLWGCRWGSMLGLNWGCFDFSLKRRRTWVWIFCRSLHFRQTTQFGSS